MRNFLFLSTLSLRRATYLDAWKSYYVRDFYPRSPCGERLFNPLKAIIILTFLSTLSLRRATPPRVLREPAPTGFLSTLSLRRATLQIFLYYQDNKFLSTLSLRRATSMSLNTQQRHLPFLSTLSLRRATTLVQIIISGYARDFYPRSPCGERPACPFLQSECPFAISIHALLAESDLGNIATTRTLFDFYPRSPCGERLQLDVMITTFYYFYPRSPCGERQEKFS